jgi:hypothetical protein
LKPWSLLFGLNGFTHELIGPKQIIFYSQINNIILITLVCKMSQEVLEFPIYWSQDFLTLTRSLKQALVKIT